jgi:hypothetical protein
MAPIELQPPKDRPRLPKPVSTAILQQLSDVKCKRVSWLWHDRIPMGKVTIIAGDPGLGKSLATLDMAARVSSGEPWPDAPDDPVDSGGVVLLSAEDDLGDTIKPRLLAAGATVERIVSLKAVRYCNGDIDRKEMFSLSSDMPRLREAIDSVPECRLVVIDPITAYCGSVDSHKNAEVRSLLVPLADLAAETGVAIVAVSHLNKSNSGPAVYRTMGSLAFVAAARAAYGVVADRDDARRRLFLPVKTNLAPSLGGLAFVIESSQVSVDHDLITAPIIKWDPDPVEVKIDDALRQSTDEGGAVRDAVDFLQQALGDGALIPAKDVLRTAADEGLGQRSVRAAFKKLNGKSKKGFQGAADWWLPVLANAPNIGSPACHGGTANTANVGPICDNEHTEHTEVN